MMKEDSRTPHVALTEDSRTPHVALTPESESESEADADATDARAKQVDIKGAPEKKAEDCGCRDPHCV